MTRVKFDFWLELTKNKNETRMLSKWIFPFRKD